MAFPHPEAREDKQRDEDVPRSRGVLRDLLKRTVDVANDRNGKDEVNQAKNRALGNHRIPFR